MKQNKDEKRAKSQPQRQRFVEAAKKAGAEESEAVFDATLKKIASAKVATQKSKRGKRTTAKA